MYKSPELSAVKDEVNRPSFRMPSMELSSPGFDNIPSEQIEYDKKLGEGFSSVVHLGVWKQSETQKSTVAVKRFNEEFELCFSHEVKAQKKLKESGTHPHLVNVYGMTDSLDNELVMEYVEGQELTHWLRDSPRDDFETSKKAYEIALKVLSGLVFLHSANVIHMDIKPDNIILSMTGEPKLYDLGLAEVMPPGQTSMTVQTAGGTAKYAPLEKFKRNPDGTAVISFETDVYSFMLVLLLCASIEGHEFKPEEKTLSKIFKRLSTNTLPTLSNEIPEATQQLIIRGLHFNQVARPTSAQAYAVLEKEVRAERFSVTKS
jgi:serine/threonine protein kinase